MPQTITRSMLLLAILVTAGTVAAEPAHPPTSIVGTWLITMDHLPEVPPLLYTYHADGTLVGSAPGAWAGNAHGVWKKVEPRIYEATQWSYVFGEDGTAAFLQKANFRVVLSPDRQGCTLEVVMWTMLPDGTVVKVITETDTGVRVNVEQYEPLPAE